MAGTVVTIGPEVEGFSIGDQVFSMADNTYAELCAVRAAILAKVPRGLDLIRAAALPLVTITGNQLVAATGIKAGQTVLVAGAAGNVGRSAVFTARERGATVKAVFVFSKFDRTTLEFMAEAVRDGKLVIPISETLPLREAAEAHAAAEKDVAGKILLVA